MGMGTQSTAVLGDMLIDDKARLAQVTDTRRLSRYHWEDLLSLKEKDKLVICVSTLQSWMKTTKMDLKPLYAAREQEDAGLHGDGGSQMTIGGKTFYELKATVLFATMHQEANSGSMTLADMKKNFAWKEVFSVQFDGTDIWHTFAWKDAINLCDDLYFFRLALDSSHQYNLLFSKDRTKPLYVKRIFWDVAHAFSSAALLIAYLNRVM